MSESVVEMGEMNTWCGLLEETRKALSTFGADELEEMAARAERMLAATEGQRLQRQGGSKLPVAELVGVELAGAELAGAELAGAKLAGAEPIGAEIVKVAKEHRLLGELLQATDKNLEVVRRLRGGMSDRTHGGEVYSRWAR